MIYSPQSELSLEQLEILSENYPQSKFASQSLYILSHYEPDETWYHELENRYPQSEFLNQDSVAIDDSFQFSIQNK